MTYENLYGFTCVENQALAILRKHGYAVDRLYANSAMPLNRIYECLLKENGSYVNFHGLPKVQDVMKQHNVLELSRFDDASHTSVLAREAACRKNEYVLLRVTPSFARQTLLSRGWREDHFVLLEETPDGYLLHSDRPPVSVFLNEKQLAEAYAGQYFLLKCLTVKKTELYQTLWETRRYRAEDWILSTGRLVQLQDWKERILELPDPMEEISSVFCVYKLLRRQMMAYYRFYADISFAEKLLREVERTQSLHEYYRCKKNTGASMAEQILNRLHASEVALATGFTDALDQRHRTNRKEETV